VHAEFLGFHTNKWQKRDLLLTAEQCVIRNESRIGEEISLIY